MGESTESVALSEKLEGLYGQITELTVLEAAELVKAMEERLGVSAAAPVAVAAAGAAGGAEAAAEEEKTAFDVVLNATCAEYADVEIGDVHGAALAFAVARAPAEELGHHVVELPPFGDAVSVASVRAGDEIAFFQGTADSRGRGFLAYVQVYRSRYLSIGVELPDPLFELPDPEHRRVELRRLALRQ